MKCPKCHYLSFDPEPRCRNCGYTMALEGLDLPMTSTETPPSAEFQDLALRGGGESDHESADVLTPLPAEPGRRASAPRRRRRPSTQASLDDVFEPLSSSTAAETMNDAAVMGPGADAHHASTCEAPPAPVLAPATSELPLFVRTMEPADRVHAVDEAEPSSSSPLMASEPVVVPAPVVVARAAAERPARIPDHDAGHTATRRVGPLDRDLLDGLRRIETHEKAEAEAVRQAAMRADNVGPGPRLGAAALDTVILGGLATGLLWVTLRWCDLSFGQIGTLPLTPTLAFFLIVGLSYLLLFTVAGGQTVGKMVFGIRVVHDQNPGTPPRRLSVEQAVFRELLALPSILALGLGFVPALLGDERALHDRLAHTRVVRA